MLKALELCWYCGSLKFNEATAYYILIEQMVIKL